MDELVESQEPKQVWLKPITIGLLIILVGTLLSIIWSGWVKIDIYDKHLKLLDTNVLWSIILLQLLGLGLLAAKLYQKTQALKKSLPQTKLPNAQRTIFDLQNQLSKYEDREQVFLKYEKHESGYFVDKKTKQFFCPVCLQKPEHFENQLTQRNYNLFCESCDYDALKLFP